MTRTKTPEPITVDLQAIANRLAERGIQVDPSKPAEPAEPDGAWQDQRGVVRFRETDAERTAREAVRLNALRERWESRVPAMYANASMRDLDADDLPRDLLTWLSNEASLTLFIPGPVGTGKTHAAYAIGNTAVGRGVWVEAWTVADLLESMRPGGDPAASGDARGCDLLLVDDLTVGRTASEWASEALTSLVDARLREGRRQIITTNHPYPELEACWGSRLMDRLRFRSVVAKMSGESRRQAPW